MIINVIVSLNNDRECLLHCVCVCVCFGWSLVQLFWGSWQPFAEQVCSVCLLSTFLSHPIKMQ